MKKQILLFLLMSFIPWSAWAFCSETNYSDGNSFTAFVPLNGNDSVEVTFYIISEKEKTISVGCSYNRFFIYYEGYDDDFNSFEYDSAISPNVEGVIVIPSSVNGYSVTEIGHKAFYGCNGLTSIILPNSVTFIGKYAFSGCPKVFIPCLTNIPTVEFYGFEPFWPCDARVDAFSTDCKIYVPALLLETYKHDLIWKSVSNQICAIEGEFDFDISVHAQEHASGLSSIIGEEYLGRVISLKLTGTINGYDIKVIREKMPFLRRLDLTDVDIVANSYTYYTDGNGNNYHSENDVLGDYCFANMTDLEDIQLPKDIHKIGQYAFSGCNNLRTINIPQDVISIGDCAFEGCYLKNVVVNDSEPALISSSVFPNRANMTLVIHEGNKETYLSANYWKDFKEIIDDSDIIHFADKTVERICISNWDSGERDYRSWDTNGDGLLSKEEAASVESTAEIVPQWAVLALESRFLETDITSFDEFKYFTGLTTIEGWTFSGCDKLSSITIPENVYYIEGDEGYSYISNQEASINTWKRKCGLGAFNSCSSLTSIYIPENVKGIGNNAFYGCNGL